MQLIDISPLLSEKTAVWPGDIPLKRQLLCEIKNGDNIDLSSLTSTVHIGAHADAPHHYHRDGVTIDSVSLEPYIGPCFVHTVRDTALITPKDCALPLAQGAKRILFHTGTFPNPEQFNQNFCAFSPEAIALMGESGVILIGIDTPSVDPFDSKTLPAHQQLYKYNIRNIEGLTLSHVMDGHYELIALPLALKGFDASPVRAILRRD